MPPYPASQRLARSFFERPAPELAPLLVGAHLVELQNGRPRLAARIVEVEAYRGVGQDPASHAHRGRTIRNAEMFATPGRLYVYFTYGMHFCMNVVCESEGAAGAVLLRAAEPLLGEELMARRRGRDGVDLANGPAKLCQAFGVDLSSNGWDLCVGSALGLWPGRTAQHLARTTRIGIRRGIELPYRWYDADSRHVSRARPSGL